MLGPAEQWHIYTYGYIYTFSKMPGLKTSLWTVCSPLLVLCMPMLMGKLRLMYTQWLTNTLLLNTWRHKQRLHQNMHMQWVCMQQRNHRLWTIGP